MKKNVFRKLITSTAAILAVVAMAVPNASVFAADTPTVNEPPAVVLTDTAIATTTDIVVKKDIVLFNVDSSPILSPNIDYSYKVTSANVNNATITTYASSDFASGSLNNDAVPITVTVKPGPIGAITIGNAVANNNEVAGTISFGNSSAKNVDSDTVNDNVTKHATNDEYGTDKTKSVDLSKKVTSSMTIHVDASKIYDTDDDGNQNNAPGVYRYKIEDVTTADTLKKSGIERNYKTDATNDEDKYIYLDVYTKYENNEKNSLVIYGYVLLKDVTGKDNVSLEYKTTENLTETVKITGFDTDSENEATYGNSNAFTAANLTSDAYHTYNVKVTKKVDGDLADAQNNFPFKVELTNTGTNAVTSKDDFYYIIKKDGTEIIANNPSLGDGKLANTEKAAFLATDGSWTLDGTTDTNLQLQHNDYIEIIGLPQNTKITVTETNNTNDTYSVSAKVNDTAVDLKKNGTGDAAASLSVEKNAKAQLSEAKDVNQTSGKDTIEFTNTLKDISVTGLLFNVAPFAFITVAGAGLLGLLMRNKRNSESESKI